ncbi:MAG TPA: hypothetical protein VFC93_00640 [Chloroflexota bacterium]|nr:hypothetical protein [Chloroflexota bacterium]
MPVPDLRQVVAAFAADFPTRLIPPSEDTPEPQLFVDVGPDGRGRPRRLELIFLPHDDNAYYLQLFILLPFAVVPERAAELARIVAAVNLKLPLVGFGMSEQDGWVFYRAVVPVPNDRELDAEVVSGAGWMAYYLVDQCADLLEDVATGAKTFAEGRHAFEQVLIGQPSLP